LFRIFRASKAIFYLLETVPEMLLCKTPPFSLTELKQKIYGVLKNPFLGIFDRFVDKGD
jgi:hypothetical protein